MKYLSSMTSLECILDSFESVYEEETNENIRKIIIEKRNEHNNTIIKNKILHFIKNDIKGPLDESNINELYFSPKKLEKIRKGGNLPELKDKFKFFEKFYNVNLGKVTNFIQIRNHITHTGKIPSNKEPVKEYIHLRKTLDKMIRIIIGIEIND